MTLKVLDLELVREDGVPLLGPLTLTLAPGDRLALVGESGSGKSLLIQALFGVLPRGVRLQGGRWEAFGIPGDRLGAGGVLGHRLAWVPQDPLQALNPFLNLRDHLTLLPGVHLRESPSRTLDRLGPLLESLRLPRDRSFLARFPFQISGGQRQRLVLAMALSCDPELLVLDEPTTALDPTVQADFLQLMTDLQRERGLGYLWITHDLGVAAVIADRMLVLYGGEPLEAGLASDLLARPQHPYTQRLISAARGEPSLESGFLPAPGEGPKGCPFQERCPSRLDACAHWGPWKGSPERGIRCEAWGMRDVV